MIFNTDSLLSKWGFGDGDILEDLKEWKYTPEFDHEAKTLYEIVKRHIIPKLEQKVEICYIGTNHNPVRATSVDGKDVDKYWYGDYDADYPILTPEIIEIPNEIILKVAEEITHK